MICLGTKAPAVDCPACPARAGSRCVLGPYCEARLALARRLTRDANESARRLSDPRASGVMGIKMLTKHADSHLDHHLTDAQIAHVLARFADRAAFFIETIELPTELGTVPCGLHGPLMGDPPVPEAEVTHEKRGTRAWTSRLVDRPARPVRTITVIAGPHDGHACVVFTMFGGPLAPQEPGDIRRQIEEVERQRYGLSDLSDEHKRLTAQLAALREKRDAADAFWAEHGLSKT